MGMSDLKTTVCKARRIDARTTEVFREEGNRAVVATVRKEGREWRAYIIEGGHVSPPYRRHADAVLAGVADELAGIRGTKLEWPIDTAELD